MESLTQAYADAHMALGFWQWTHRYAGGKFHSPPSRSGGSCLLKGLRALIKSKNRGNLPRHPPNDGTRFCTMCTRWWFIYGARALSCFFCFARKAIFVWHFYALDKCWKALHSRNELGLFVLSAPGQMRSVLRNLSKLCADFISVCRSFMNRAKPTGRSNAKNGPKWSRSEVPRKQFN